MKTRKFLSPALAVVIAVRLLTVPAGARGDMGKVGESNIVKLGSAHTAVVDVDGALWTWGWNNYGQLGNGTKEDSAVPIKVMENVSTVSLGVFHTAAIQTDGSLWMWGNNAWGKLGGGEGGNDEGEYGRPIQTVPVKIMDDVVAVSCGDEHTAAIDTNGSLWMWGENEKGQLGNGGGADFETPMGVPVQAVPIKVMDNVTAVSCGRYHTAAIQSDGSLWMWGSNDIGQLGNGGEGDSSWHELPIQTVPVKVMDNVAAVSCGIDHTAAIQTDGSLWMWGSNGYGELGNNSTDSCSTTPVKVMDNVSAVSCGYYHTAAVQTDGTLWSWGGNRYGQLCNDDRDDSAVPIKIMGSVVTVSCGNAHTAAITSDGSLWAWGWNEYGQVYDLPGTIADERVLVDGITLQKAEEPATAPEETAKPASGTPGGEGGKTPESADATPKGESGGFPTVPVALGVVGVVGAGSAATAVFLLKKKKR